MVYSHKYIKRISLAASAFGLIQGALWFLGSVFSICIYYNLFTLDLISPSLPSYICEILASDYDRTIILFTYVYAVLSLTLCLSSALIINGIVAGDEENIHKLYVSWSSNMIILSIVDIVLTCFLGRDLSNDYYYFGNPPKDLVTAYTILLLLSIRGIIIWFINIICSGYMIVFAAQLAQNSSMCRQDNNVINAFGESSGSWRTNLGNNPLSKTSRKENFIFGDANKIRSYDSLIATKELEELSIKSDIFKNNENYGERLANIGKPGKRSPLKSSSPVNVSPPIPPPLNLGKPLEDTESIADILPNINHPQQGHHTNSTFRDDSQSDPDSPYIPPPDYTPLGTPIPALNSRTKSERSQNTFF